MSSKRWFIGFVMELFLLLIGIAVIVIFTDPYFHYHKPMNSLFYTLNNQRSQNDGIIKNFDYDSIITGTSMSENFKVSEFDKIFHVNSIKVCFSGGTYKEIDENVKKAFDSDHTIKYVLRCLDYSKIIMDKDNMRTDLGEYPTYLYDKNVFNDIKYILNKEILFDLSFPMVTNAYLNGEDGGITSFDEYSNWNDDFIFGKENVLGSKKEYKKAERDVNLSKEDYEVIKGNIEQNVLCLAQKHPETVFYYFISPYSIVYWGELYEKGMLNRQIDAEKVAIEQILQCENIKLFSFNNHWEITTDLNNYKDSIHYGEWINREIIHMIHENIGLLSKDNYKEYLEKEREFYSNYVYKFNSDDLE